MDSMRDSMKSIFDVEVEKEAPDPSRNGMSGPNPTLSAKGKPSQAMYFEGRLIGRIVETQSVKYGGTCYCAAVRSNEGKHYSCGIFPTFESASIRLQDIVRNETAEGYCERVVQSKAKGHHGVGAKASRTKVGQARVLINAEIRIALTNMFEQKVKKIMLRGGSKSTDYAEGFLDCWRELKTVLPKEIWR